MDNKLVVVVFDLWYLLWGFVFLICGIYFDVKIINWCLRRLNVLYILFVFLLLNLDKLFRVFGYEV